jgi:hypothetical protein
MIRKMSWRMTRASLWTDGCGRQNGRGLRNMIKLTQSFRIIDAFLDSVCGTIKQDPESDGKSLRFLNKKPRKTC